MRFPLYYTIRSYTAFPNSTLLCEPVLGNPIVQFKLFACPRKRASYTRIVYSYVNSALGTLKKPGLLTPSHSRGGGGVGFRPPPPRISAAERRKILKFGTYVGLVNTNMLTKLQYWKSKRFWIMQIYVNYMHVFLFFILTDKMRPFGASNCFDIVVETFNIILNKKTAQFSFISYVFYCLWISYVFLCFCDLCILLFFYMELFEYWISLNITVILTVMKANTAF